MGCANAAPPRLLLFSSAEHPPHDSPKPTGENGGDEVSARIKATLRKASDLTAPLTIERSELAHYSERGEAGVRVLA
jgi:hypothetical protein